MRYIEALSEEHYHRIDLQLEGEHTANKPVMNLSEFTRENVAKWLYTLPRSVLDCYSIKDFHVVFDDMEIPWATKESHDKYERVWKAFNAAEEQRLKMKNSILAFLLMLPMLSFGQPVQLTVFYKQKTVLHESARAAIRFVSPVGCNRREP
jgi:hypothetical protein